MRAILAIIFMTLSLQAASVWTTHGEYEHGESVTVGMSGVIGESNNWVGVFRDGEVSSWDNIVDAKWFDFENGEVTFDNLPDGFFRVRVFYNDSLHQEAVSSRFDIGQGPAVGEDATISTNKTTYQSGEDVTVSLGNIIQGENNWVGIFKDGEISSWNNIVDAKWFNFTDGNVTFDNLASGTYQVRVFFNDSLHEEAVTGRIEIGQEPVVAPTISTDKTSYQTTEDVIVTLGNIQGLRNNWVGVFKDTEVSDWDNIIEAEWFNFENGNVTFANLPVGSYQVRVFYNDSLNPKAVTSRITIIQEAVADANISTNKATYQRAEDINVSLANVQGQHNNWVGIFPAGSASEWGTLVLAEWFNFTTGSLIFENTLAAGEYEARLFYNDSLASVKIAQFSIEQGVLAPTMYEDAENNNTAGWSTIDGPFTIENVLFDGTRAIYGAGHWINGSTYNNAFYKLVLDNGNLWNNTTQHILELDFNAGGDAACFQIGVEVQTTQGFRMMMFSAWYGRAVHNFPPVRTVYDDNLVILTYPFENSDAYMLSTDWMPYKVNLKEKLELLEPGNSIISIGSFILNGSSVEDGDGKGHIDNIKLSSE